MSEILLGHFVGEWQPIATAPRDGTWFLVLVDGSLPVTLGRYQGREDYPWQFMDENSDGTYSLNGYLEQSPPQYWMRLPSPPRSADPTSAEQQESKP